MFSDNQWEILVGSLMGDGSVTTWSDSYPKFTVNMTNPKYIYYLWKEFGVLSGDTVGHYTQKELESADMEGFSDDPHCKPVYSWRTKAHPLMMLFTAWYCSGEKVFPKDVSLTPTVLRHWYCGDGGLGSRFNSCRLHSANESEDFSNILSMFRSIGFSPNTTGHHIRFSTEKSRDFLDYISPLPPGFKHKAILDDRDAYERQRERDYQPPEELTR
jgi:hypothetical protein